jgi:hypothetical protein
MRDVIGGSWGGMFEEYGTVNAIKCDEAQNKRLQHPGELNWSSPTLMYHLSSTQRIGHQLPRVKCLKAL